ncbi:MAG TPA: glucuronate isomerase [Pseudolysinimonas sp.]|jgi:glucuronate isomerase|nr:glucuronate isomerase [Pseudolysinimonas sp.]
MTATWLDPDRLFPPDPATRSVARDLFALVEHAPIVSPHGHVDPGLLLHDTPFTDAAALLVSSDHYVTRLLHADGVPLELLLHGDAREVWRAFSARWHLFAGTASGTWLRETLGTIFSLPEPPNGDNADEVFDLIGAQLAEARLRPRALFASFGIDVLATTDGPMDDLAAHAAIAADPAFPGRVLPTFRPDAYLDPSRPGWRDAVERLGASGYTGYLDALRARRAFFLDHGAVSADHGVVHAASLDLNPSEAAALFDKGMAGTIDAAEAEVFRAHMLFESARMSVEDGLVMTVHAGVHRNHHSATLRDFGPDTGHDIPLATSFTGTLHPLLERFGTAAGFHLILFALDESVWSREVAPLAGFYPAVFVGAPWWFLDAPDAILRFRAATAETAGLYRGSGFIDDTRAFLSIAARHATARRLDSAYLARLVVEGRISRAEAERIAHDLVDAIPRRAFRL